MALGDSLTADGMVELRGVTMGNSTYQLIDWSPWAGADVVSNTAPALTGVRSGLDTFGARMWVMRCWVTGADSATMTSNLQALAYAWRPGSDAQIAFRSGGTKYMRYGRAAGAFPDNAYKYPTELRFRCDDPYTYSCTEHTDASVSTLTFPTDLVGNRASSAWRMTVAGPCTGPRLRYNAAQPDGDGQYDLDFPTLTIPSGYTLYVDAHAGTVLLTADSTGATTSQRAKARNGSTGGIADLLPMSDDPFWWFTSDSGTSTCAMFWRDCWT